MSKTIIVTGGCGYIGSHIVRALRKEDAGNRIVVIDRVLQNHTLADVDCVLDADYASDAALRLILQEQPDAIVHCAGTSLVGPSVTDPADYYDNNVAKTITMLNTIKLMTKKPVIVFSSSASVYGEPKCIPITEFDRRDPISPYGRTKAMIEDILQDYKAAYGISSICFRYFNAAGAEPMNYDLGQAAGATHIVARILEATINQTPFTLYGNQYSTPDGTCIRDYVHVWDIAQAHVLGIGYLLHAKSCSLKLNLGTGSGISNQQIIDYVKQKYGFDLIQHADARAGDPAELVATAATARDLLSWNPQYSTLEAIVDSAYKWYTRQ